MKRILLCIALFIQTSISFSSELEPLEVRLGYPKGTKLLIINADDYGMSHAENMGTRKVLNDGIVTSATMMIPPSWSDEAMKYVLKTGMKNIGVHVTLTSEWSRYKWRPLTRDEDGGSSLVGENGYFWETSIQVEKNAKMEDVIREVRAQLQTPMKRGIELSHFDSHMGSLYGLFTGRVELLAVALALSYEFGLPYRMPRHPLTTQFENEGFVLLDNLIMSDNPSDPAERKEWFLKNIKNIKPGVTELFIHPSVESSEIKAITGRWKTRKMEMELFTDPATAKLVQSLGIVLIDYQVLKKLQREQMKWQPQFSFEQVYKKYLKMLGVN
jgi:chitin disaccharide deacetylase